MRTAVLLSTAALLAMAACTEYDDDPIGPGDGELEPPSELTYQLIPSGDPDFPDGVLLRWTEPDDDRVVSYVVYSRGSTGDGWSRRAVTTSGSFHDTGIPHLQYYVASMDEAGDESRGSNTITVDEGNRLATPNALSTVSLDRAMQLSWASNARTGDPDLFDYYRVYSSPYDLDADECDDDAWVLEGTTVSEDFLATGLTNGVPRCFAVSAVSLDGHESTWSGVRSDTPRYDARNVLVFANQAQSSQSGFRFWMPSSGAFGSVLPGTRADLDFRVDRHSDGSLWMVPVRAGVRVAVYGSVPAEDLTSIDIAPEIGYSSGAVEALPGWIYVFETLESNGLHYGAVRITHVGKDYLILDWAYQSDPGNPDLKRFRRGSAGGAI
jgi:hypothetical protein